MRDALMFIFVFALVGGVFIAFATVGHWQKLRQARHQGTCHEWVPPAEHEATQARRDALERLQGQHGRMRPWEPH